jgi:hypothetical protein
MKSARRGNATSVAEVINVSNRSFWVLLDPSGRELYLSFRDFPWFAEATIRQLCSVEVERGHILRWPDLDVDLDLERIEHPERYPLVALGPRRRGRLRPQVA